MISVLFLSTIGISVVTYTLGIVLFERIGLTDFPERYGLQRKPIAYPLGIVSIILFLAIGGPLLFTLPGIDGMKILIGIIVFGIVCFLDDRWMLPVSVRISAQLILAIWCFYAGAQIFTITNPFGGIINLDHVNVNLLSSGVVALWSLIFTVTWLFFTTNAFNWSDGIPLNTALLTTSGSIGIALLAILRTEQENIAAIAIILAGMSIGAVITEHISKKRILFGDTGAMFFGVLLGILGILQGGKVATLFLACGIPLSDAMIVILKRIIAHTSPFQGRRDHLHHLLENDGIHPYVIAYSQASINLSAGILALFLSTKGKVLLGVLFICTTLMVHLYYMRKRMVERNPNA